MERRSLVRRQGSRNATRQPQEGPGAARPRPFLMPLFTECLEVQSSRKVAGCEFSEVHIHDPISPYPPFCGPPRLASGLSLAQPQPTTTDGRMMDDSMYPVDAVRPLARSLRRAVLSWHDADHRLVEKFAEEMTMQDFIHAAPADHAGPDRGQRDRRSQGRGSDRTPARPRPRRRSADAGSGGIRPVPPRN
jgi:hypothetical protein